MDDVRLTADLFANVVRELKIRESMDVAVVLPDDCIHVFASQ